jgi:hypothetical protein
MNLCFVLIVVTTLALRHSGSVFSLAETAHRSTISDAISEKGELHNPLGQGLKNSLTDLRDLWHRSTILKIWFLESQTTSWARMRAAPGAEFDFVEAVFHVANAEVFGAAMGERRRAKIELDNADRYLQDAQTTVASDLLPLINAIRTEITDAKIELDIGYPDREFRGEQIKTDLHGLIQTLKGKPL